MVCGLRLAAAPASDEFVVRTWQTEDGLPQNSGTALAQTSDGYLWVGTFNGLVRFNGVDFSRFTLANTKELQSDDINTLFEDSSGRLWIGTFAGLARYDHGRFTAWSSPERLSRANIRRFAEGAKGELMVATDRGVWRIDGNDQAVEVLIPGAEWTTHASTVARGQDGEVWISHRETLFRLNGEGVQMETRFEQPIDALAVGRNGTFWIELAGQVMTFRPGHPPVSVGLDAGRVRAFQETASGDWWIASQEQGLFLWRDGEITSITTAEGLPNDRLLALAQDREGGLWVGTDGGGFCRLTRKQLTTYGIERGLTHTDVISVVEDREGQVWLGTFGGALCVGTNGQWRPYPAPGVMESDDAVVAVCQTQDGTLWIGRKGKPLLRMKNGRLEVEPRSHGDTVRALFEDSDGRLWIGTDHYGVECFRNGEVRRWSTTNGLSDNFVTAIAEDPSGAIWVGTGNGLNRISGDTVRTFFVKDGLGLNPIHSLFVDRQGVLWIGTAGGGLTRFQNGRFATVTSRQGLHGDVVAQILEDDAGDFWIGSTIGIFRVGRQSLHDVLDGRTPFVRCSAYGKKDGMDAGGCAGGFQPTCLKTRDGRLWFCTSGGLTVVDPKSVQRSELPPPVHVERLVVDGVEISRSAVGPLASGIPPGWTTDNAHSNQSRSSLPRNAAASDSRAPGSENPDSDPSHSEPLRIPPGARRLEFHCAALNFNGPEQAQFMFWLEGYEETWQEGGSRRVAYYSQVPPGGYRFHVRAANTDGVWNETGATLVVLILPTWRQTWWYRSALVLSVLGVAAAFYYRRVSELKAAKAQQTLFSRQILESQEAERKRISSELHDSLGQSLLIIKNRAARTLRGPPTIPVVDNELREISQVATDALEEVRTIARALRPFQLDAFGLSRALRSLVQQVADVNGLECELDIEPMDSLFPPESEISLYRIVQESLNNVVKHAGASRVRVAARKENDIVSFMVEDDGCGFDRVSVRSGNASRSGQGLAGMEQRVHLLCGRLEIERPAGGGTRLTVRLPLPKSG